MFYRFGGAIVLVVLVSLIGIGLEKQNLALRRGVARQHYRMDVLRDGNISRRMQVQQLGSPIQLADPVEPWQPARGR